ncbi:hypothetical protein BDA99DRAFT_577078 [Phascolomyces articulosus]|uniref:Uncharacterized protein n=1 Tax=Phascolomyces articulosus TaxID=60185 RepID=A0AAD5JW95_9FUNG|nr:hypothetical protein BDA99DRAFT_577078 [Phascolomyces articulosus]
MYPISLVVTLFFGIIAMSTKVFSLSSNVTAQLEPLNADNSNDNNTLSFFLKLKEGGDGYRRYDIEEADDKNRCDKLYLKDKCIQDMNSIEKYWSLWYECDSGAQIHKKAQKCAQAKEVQCKKKNLKMRAGCPQASENWEIVDAIKAYKDEKETSSESVWSLLLQDLEKLAEKRPFLKNTANASREKIEVYAEIIIFGFLKMLPNLSSTLQNWLIRLAASTELHKKAIFHRPSHLHSQVLPVNARKEMMTKATCAFQPLTLTPSVSLNRPTNENEDAALLNQHYYAKLSDAHVPEGVDSCIETDAEYAKNMDDQYANRSLNKVKAAMTFLEISWTNLSRSSSTMFGQIAVVQILLWMMVRSSSWPSIFSLISMRTSLSSHR